jgi:amidohydrolase
VDAAFGCHLWGDLPEGRVQVRPGPLMAAPDGFRFRIQGVGGHGSAPHQTVDPVLLGVQAISFMQGIVSRRVNPLDPAVLSVCSVHAGDCDNVIPDALEATGTVRAFDDDLRDFIAREMERILAGVTAPWGATYTFEYRKSNPPLVNDPAMAELLARAFEQSLGPGNVIRLGSPTMGSEDFAYIAQKVPSAFALVGIARDGKTPMPHHQGEFQWDDRNLLPLIRGLAQVAADFLA